MIKWNGDIHYYSSFNTKIRSRRQRVIQNIVYISIMVHCCCVPGCSNRSDRERHLSFFTLPLKNKTLLKVWIHRIGRKNLPINRNTRVCSQHFERATKRRLLSDECPTLNLPVLTTSIRKTERKPPKERPFVERLHDDIIGPVADHPVFKDASTQTNDSSIQIEEELGCSTRAHCCS